jgi:hypothetical protein
MFPIIDPDGIHTEIFIDHSFTDDDKTYDYWALHNNGSFYTKSSLFEDTRSANRIYFNTRIVKITELFMYIENLYDQMQFPKDTEISVSIIHGGLKDRMIASSGERLILRNYKYRSIEDEFSTQINTSLTDIHKNIVNIVPQFITPLFEMFDGFEVSDSIVTDIVNNYLKGKVT